jgi:hypothetical protein
LPLARKELILTAKHVLESAGTADVRFFLRPSGPIDWGARPSQPATAESVRLEIDDIVRCASEDIACIVLRPRSLRHPLEFADLPAAFADAPPPGSGTLIFGCPSDQSIPVASFSQPGGSLWRALAVRPQGCWAVVEKDPPPFFPSSYDPVRHLLLRYDPAEEGALPHGFSGAGIWYQNPAKASVWAANPVLAGVQISWHRPSNLMIAVRSEVVRGFLSDAI